MTARERIEEYGMVMPVEEMLGFRKRLAYGSAVIAEYPEQVHGSPRTAPVEIVFADGSKEIL